MATFHYFRVEFAHGCNRQPPFELDIGGKPYTAFSFTGKGIHYLGEHADDLRVQILAIPVEVSVPSGRIQTGMHTDFSGL